MDLREEAICDRHDRGEAEQRQKKEDREREMYGKIYTEECDQRNRLENNMYIECNMNEMVSISAIYTHGY